MQKGNIVIIYEDPISQMKSEGQAKILSVSLFDVSDPKIIGYSCDVEFITDGFKCVRKVYESKPSTEGNI